MKIVIDFEYDKAVNVTAFKNGKVFIKSPMKVKIPQRPFFDLENPYSCTEKQFANWEKKVYNKLVDEIKKSFKEEIYGKLFIKINGLSYAGEIKNGK